MPSHDPAVQLQNLRLQHPQLNAESRDTGARDLGQPFVAGVSVLCAPKGAANVAPAGRGRNKSNTDWAEVAQGIRASGR
jgi:hypothetical protein